MKNKLTLLEKIDFVINKTDYGIRYNYEEIAEVDFKEKEIYLTEGETMNLRDININKITVFSYKKMKYFPYDIFELSKMFSKIKKTYNKEKGFFLEAHEMFYFSKKDIKFATTTEFLYDRMNSVEFFKFKIKKDFLQKDKNFKI